MPRDNPYRPFTPQPEQMALHPGVSGNDINGLGEADERLPTMVYWSPDPDNIPHGRMQRWFYTASPPTPNHEEIYAWRKEILDAPLSPLAETQTTRDPQDWTDALGAFVSGGLCEMTGVTPMRDAYLYEDTSVAFRNVIVLGVQHDYDTIRDAPAPTAGEEVTRQYGRAAKVAKDVASWLRGQGWEAEPVTGPMTGSITLIPPALDCGFGELGKHGSIINPELGASFRLSAVLTDAPFAPTPPRDFGIDDFCQSCRICEDACPPEALSPDKQIVRGVEKWYVDFEKCLPFFNQTRGCAICIAVCPWSRPGVGMNLAAKLARRAERVGST